MAVPSRIVAKPHPMGWFAVMLFPGVTVPLWYALRLSDRTGQIPPLPLTAGLTLPFFSIGLCLAAWLVSREIVANKEGVRWRKWLTWRFTAWRDVEGVGDHVYHAHTCSNYFWITVPPALIAIGPVAQLILIHYDLTVMNNSRPFVTVLAGCMLEVVAGFLLIRQSRIILSKDALIVSVLGFQRHIAWSEIQKCQIDPGFGMRLDAEGEANDVAAVCFLNSRRQRRQATRGCRLRRRRTKPAAGIAAQSARPRLPGSGAEAAPATMASRPPF